MSGIQPYVLRDIPVSSIIITKLQVRSSYDKDKMRELTRSIRETGVMQGIVVRPYRRDRFELVFGSRRLKSARKAGERTIPCLVKENINDRDVIVLALNENLHRQDLEPFEEARAFLRLMKDFKMSIREITDKIGRDASFVRRRLKLLKMPKEVQQLIAEKKLPVRHVDLLSSLSVGEQRQVALNASTHKLAHRDLQVHIQEMAESTPKIRTARKKGITGEWDSEKLKLRIKDFTRFIKNVRPIILEMGPVEIHTVRLALEGLSKEADSAIEEFRSFSKV